MKAEEWRPVIGYEGQYEVSNWGRARSLDHVTVDSIGRRKFFPGKLLRPNLTGTPLYPTVALHRNSRTRTTRIHIIVLEAFVGPRPPGMRHIRHLDGDPTNNHLTNLAYGTCSENMRDVVRHGRHQRANQTHCKHGHEYTLGNTYWNMRNGRTTRQCRECALRRSNLAYITSRRLAVKSA